MILERISLDTPDCTEYSLKQHVSNLRKKLREAGGKEYIQAVWGIGFRLDGDGAGKSLCKHYRRFKALDGLDMEVPKGAIYGLVGKNGAGKTTLIRVICGLQRPSGGSYSLYGAGLSEAKLNRARRRMGAVVETPSLYPDMTAEQNLKLQYRVLGLPDDGGIPELLELVGLSNTGRKKAGHFSLGMKQRLGIAIALCGDPDFLVLDEPINGLDPQILKLNRERQITVLISSHILDELSKLATHYGFIDSGRMVKEVSAQELEAACRKCARVEVTSVPALCRVLDGWQLEYSVVDGAAVDLRGAEHHRPGGRAAQRGLQPAFGEGAGREPGELLHQPGGR